jgi:hypothetical protein
VLARATLALVLCAAATPAAADARGDASQHVQRGVALYELGRFEEAIAEFEAAYLLFPTSALLFNLGQAHRKLDHCAEALDHYRRFLARDPESPRAGEVRGLLPELERACAVRDVNPDGVQGEVAPAPAPAPEEPAAAEPELVLEEPAPRLRLAAALAAGSLVAGGGAVAPVGVIASGSHAVERIGAEIGGLVAASGFAWSRAGRSGTSSVISLAATIGRATTAGGLGLRVDGGAGIVAIGGLETGHPLLGLGQRLEGTVVAPELRLAVAASRPLSDGWAVIAGAGGAVSTGGALGGAVATVHLAVGVEHRR